jgi:hypothetical protein
MENPLSKYVSEPTTAYTYPSYIKLEVALLFQLSENNDSQKHAVSASVFPMYPGLNSCMRGRELMGFK